jgi:hypothetical protein
MCAARAISRQISLASERPPVNVQAAAPVPTIPSPRRKKTSGATDDA